MPSYISSQFEYRLVRLRLNETGLDHVRVDEKATIAVAHGEPREKNVADPVMP